MEELNILGDIHGSHDALMALTKIMPKAPFISVGDMLDRGPRSLEVLRFFMEPGNLAILGNHEHMCLDVYFGRKIYAPGVWLDYRNGGLQTLRSFNNNLITDWMHYMAFTGKPPTVEACLKFVRKNRDDIFPADVMKWIDKLPCYMRRPGLFISHAPRHPGRKWADLMKSKTDRMRMSGPVHNLLWNVGEPGPRKGVVQVNGHIITKEPVFLGDNGTPYSISIDTCRGYGSKLTGLHWPSLEVFQVEVRATDTTQNICENAVAKPPQNPL
jgi:hypothetical protein